MSVDPLGPLVGAFEELAGRAGQVPPSTRLGTVTSVPNSSAVTVLFDGETTASGKTYQRLTSYGPAVGDRALLLRVGSTYVAVGAVAAPVAVAVPATVAEVGDVPDTAG